ncbi:MAG TPA: hypothetical protein VIC55_07260, partial [Gemmatimonadaceae bacterium]
MIASVAATAVAHAQDPCSLLSATEARTYVGTLASPPYRASGDPATPNVAGGVCVYRGTDGRVLTIEPDWTGGKTMASVQNTVTTSSQSLGKATGMDSSASKIAQQGPTGPWDKATWYPTGTLFVVKGNAAVIIDVSGTSGLQNDAYAVAKSIVPRIGHPLAYDGAKAVALAPKPVKHPANACNFVSRAEVERAIGPLSGAPTPDASGTGCTYHVATAQGSRAYPVEFVWQGGQKNYNMLKHGPAMMGGLLGAPTSTPMDTMKPTGTMGGMMAGMMKMVTGAPASQASGAPSTVGFTTDTTLKGPWDNASLLHGTQLIAVRHDVFVGMDLQSADYAKAKALMTAICTHL